MELVAWKVDHMKYTENIYKQYSTAVIFDYMILMILNVCIKGIFNFLYIWY